MTTLATYVRDQIYARLTVPNIAPKWKSTRRIPLPTAQENQLPCLSVYLVRESMIPDGDDNVSVPRYVSDALIGISVFDSGDKPDIIDGSLDPLVDLIEDTLLQDGTFVSLAYSDGTPLIESIPSITRLYSFPQTGEKYLIEVKLQLTVRFRCYFEPLAPNPLTDVLVTVVPTQGTVLPEDESVMDIQLPQT